MTQLVRPPPTFAVPPGERNVETVQLKQSTMFPFPTNDSANQLLMTRYKTTSKNDNYFSGQAKQFLLSVCVADITHPTGCAVLKYGIANARDCCETPPSNSGMTTALIQVEFSLTVCEVPMLLVTQNTSVGDQLVFVVCFDCSDMSMCTQAQVLQSKIHSLKLDTDARSRESHGLARSLCHCYWPDPFAFGTVETAGCVSGW